MAVEVQRRPPLSNGALGSGHQVSSIKRPPRKPKECISVNGQSRTHFLSNDPSESSTGDESAHNSEEALANRSGDSAISGKRKRTAPAPTEAQLPDHLEEPVAKRFRSGSTEHFTSAEDESSDLSPAQPSRKYRCEFEGCGRVFKKSSKLRRHERTHFNEVCRKTWVRCISKCLFSCKSHFGSALSPAHSQDVPKRTSETNIWCDTLELTHPSKKIKSHSVAKIRHVVGGLQQNTISIDMQKRMIPLNPTK